MAKVYDRPAIDGRVIDLESVLSESGVFITKGTVGEGGTYSDVTDIPASKVAVNDRYRVTKDGTYNNGKLICQEGDFIYCSKKDGETIEWSFYRPLTVEGPISSIENAIPIFYNKNGNKLKDSKYKISDTSVTDNEKIIAVVKDIENHNLDSTAHSKYIPDSQLNSSSEQPIQNKAVYSALELKANDEEVLHLTGDEVINGNKIFEGNVKINYLEATISGQIDSAINATYAEKLGINTIGAKDQPFYLLSGVATAFSNTIGGYNNPVYLSNGHITSFSNNIGDENTPVYLSSGVITPFKDTIGTARKPVYVDRGSIVEWNNTIGGPKNPVYVNNGTISEINATVGNGKQPIYLNTGVFSTINETIGTENIPVYLNGGVITAASHSFEEYMPLTGGTFTNEVYAITQNDTDSTTKLATTAYVKNVVSNVVDNAPEMLDTLRELAQAIGDDPNFVGTVISQLSLKANDSTVVHLTGNEIISGTKTFTTGVVGVITSATNATSAMIASSAVLATSANHATIADYVNNTPSATSAVHATTADSATYATKATTADSTPYATNANLATTATTATTATKIGSVNIGDVNTPVYVEAGVVKTTGKSFENYFLKTGGTINGSLTVTGTITGGAVYGAVWNDYAELFPKGEETEAGDIIALDESSHKKEQYIKATNKSKFVVGVHSDSYGHLLGGDRDSLENNLKKYIPVGLAGRIEVKFIGESKLGEGVVPSEIPGVGCLFNKKKYKEKQIIGYIVFDENPTSIEERKIKIKIGK